MKIIQSLLLLLFTPFFLIGYFYRLAEFMFTIGAAVDATFLARTSGIIFDEFMKYLKNERK